MQARFSRCLTECGLNWKGAGWKGSLASDVRRLSQAWSHKAALWLPVRLPWKDALPNTKQLLPANAKPWAKTAQPSRLTFPRSGTENMYNLE